MYCSLLAQQAGCSGEAVQLAGANKNSRLSRSAVAAWCWQNGSSLAACTVTAGVQLGPFLLTASLVPECLDFASVRLPPQKILGCSAQKGWRALSALTELGDGLPACSSAGNSDRMGLCVSGLTNSQSMWLIAGGCEGLDEGVPFPSLMF